MVTFSSKFELESKTLGNLTASNLTMWAVGHIRDLVTGDELGSEEFVAEFLSRLSRRRDPEVEYADSPTIEASRFRSLPADEIEDLACQYLQKSRLKQDGVPLVDKADADATSNCSKLKSKIQGVIQKERMYATDFAKSQPNIMGRTFEPLHISPALQEAKRKLNESFTNTAVLGSRMGQTLSELARPLPAATSDFKPLERIRDPGFETNNRLFELNERVESLVTLAGQQAEMAEAIRSLSERALELSIQSGGQAAEATRVARTANTVAVLVLILSIATAALNFWQSYDSSKSATRSNTQLVELLKRIAATLDRQAK